MWLSEYFHTDQLQCKKYVLNSLKLFKTVLKNDKLNSECDCDVLWPTGYGSANRFACIVQKLT